MRTIIAGSRHIHEDHHLRAALARCPWADEITAVVCGGAPGVDCLGDQWAKAMGLPVFYYVVTTASAYPWDRLKNLVMVGGGVANAVLASDWKWDGDAAGPIRNRAMAANADALLAIPLQGDRRGTDSMLRAAYRRNLRVFTWEVAR